MSQELKIAIEIATKAGELLRERFGKSDIVRIKDDQSMVSDSDFISHDFIMESLTRSFPTYTILSEESPNALHTPISKNPTWIVDPLDGTSNFLSSIPLFGVALALVADKKTQIGVIYDPIHHEMFAAEKGQGTMLNGSPVFVSKKQVPQGAMLFAGRGYKNKHRVAHAGIISILEQQTTYFRRLGSASIMLAYVASGRADAVILTGNDPWDMIAGSLLVTEAGGLVSDYCGNPWSIASENLAATNAVMHEKLIEITKKIKGDL